LFDTIKTQYEALSNTLEQQLVKVKRRTQSFAEDAAAERQELRTLVTESMERILGDEDRAKRHKDSERVQIAALESMIRNEVKSRSDEQKKSAAKQSEARMRMQKQLEDKQAKGFADLAEKFTARQGALERRFVENVVTLLLHYCDTTVTPL
jgi:hypothetical protein